MSTEKFYPMVNEKNEPINEIYKNYFVIDEEVPSVLKREFKNIVKMISDRLRDERFSEMEIENYLKDLIEEIV
jgi:hypothetical protein